MIINTADYQILSKLNYYHLPSGPFFTPRRFMQRVASLTRYITPQINPISNVIVKNEVKQPYATKTALKVGLPDANDGMKKVHTHIGKECCILDDCETTKCLALCAHRISTKILGHNTHKPPIGRMAKRISDIDAQGNSKTQWFIKSNTNNVINEQERQQKGSNIKEDTKQDSFIKQHADKYD